MRANESLPCSRCPETIRRGSPIVLVRGLWLHPACVYRPARVRPFVAGGAR